MNFATIFMAIIFIAIFVYICVFATALLRWLWRRGDKK